MHTGIWWGNLDIRDNLEDLDVDGRAVLKWILEEQDRGVRGLD